MSAWSDWKAGHLTDDEYKSAMRRECEDHYPTDKLPFEPTCECCEYCKQGLAFAYSIIDLDGKKPTKDTPGDSCVLKKDLHKQGYIQLCVKDIEHIKEVHLFDAVCEDHGELFEPEDM